MFVLTAIYLRYVLGRIKRRKLQESEKLYCGNRADLSSKKRGGAEVEMAVLRILSG
jgi:hypothetical protein